MSVTPVRFSSPLPLATPTPTAAQTRFGKLYEKLHENETFLSGQKINDATFLDSNELYFVEQVQPSIARAIRSRQEAGTSAQERQRLLNEPVYTFAEKQYTGRDVIEAVKAVYKTQNTPAKKLIRALIPGQPKVQGSWTSQVLRQLTGKELDIDTKAGQNTLEKFQDEVLCPLFATRLLDIENAFLWTRPYDGALMGRLAMLITGIAWAPASQQQ